MCGKVAGFEKVTYICMFPPSCCTDASFVQRLVECFDSGTVWGCRGWFGFGSAVSQPSMAHDLLLPDVSWWNMFLGTPKEPGLLPRVLDATFQYIAGRQYEAMDLKPYRRNDAQYLGPDQIKQERSAKTAIFASFKEVSGFYSQIIYVIHEISWCYLWL